jgi:hypothetical protein
MMTILSLRLLVENHRSTRWRARAIPGKVEMWTGRNIKAATKRRNENEKVDWNYDVVRSCDVGGTAGSEGSEQHCAGGHGPSQESDEKACEES